MSNLKFLSIHSPKYLTLLFTAIGRPSHNIFGFCVAVLAPGVLTNALDFESSSQLRWFVLQQLSHYVILVILFCFLKKFTMISLVYYEL